ncbi:MBLC1 protein, partial [Psilopogon haemacephalus]|nr:MBLC1 protein [Psilopogon haemacephalus]
LRLCPLGGRLVPGVPYSLHVLLEGHSSLGPEGGGRAEGSISLVRGGPVTALVDTGGPWARGQLLGLLAAQGLRPEEVTHVVVTHGHSDHVGNVNLFPEATLVVGTDVSLQDGLYLPQGLAWGLPYALHPGHLEVVPTPGHTLDHVSLLLRGTSLGTVLVAGDLFERQEDEEVWRSLSQDQAQQERSRSWALSVADVIVPGHGAAFRVCRQGEVP